MHFTILPIHECLKYQILFFFQFLLNNQLIHMTIARIGSQQFYVLILLFLDLYIV